MRKYIDPARTADEKVIMAPFLSATGRHDEALRLLVEAGQNRKKDYVSAYSLGETYSLIGEKDRALYWLEQSFIEHDSYLLDLRWNPRFDGLRNDRRYFEIEQRLPK